jgi:hypothetical protein
MSENPADHQQETPEILQLVESSARRVAQLEGEAKAERERRDRHMVEAVKSGCTYEATAAAAKRGDQTATKNLVYIAMTKYA